MSTIIDKAKNALQSVLPIAGNPNDDRVPGANFDPSYEEAAKLVREGKAADIGEGRRKIALDKIRDGEIAEPPLADPLLKSLASERKAREALAKAERDREAAAELQVEWEELAKRLTWMRAKCERAEAELANAKQEGKAAREKLFTEIGDPHSQVTIHFGAGRFAGNVAQLEAGIPILEEALRAVHSELNAHVAETRRFGSRIGIRADLLP
jgi:hypothetical protein